MLWFEYCLTLLKHILKYGSHCNSIESWWDLLRGNYIIKRNCCLSNENMVILARAGCIKWGRALCLPLMPASSLLSIDCCHEWKVHKVLIRSWADSGTMLLDSQPLELWTTINLFSLSTVQSQVFFHSNRKWANKSGKLYVTWNSLAKLNSGSEPQPPVFKASEWDAKSSITVPGCNA